MKRLLNRLVAAGLLAAGLGAPTVACAQAPGALGAEGAQLLLTRAGFAPASAEVERLAGLSHAQAVDRLLAEARTTAATPAPAWIDEPFVGPRQYRDLSDDAKRLERQRQIRWGLELRGWWLREMAGTASPLTERMTLFWHNHFVSAQPKVRWSQLMYRQNVLLRQHALGNFGELLHAVARDPAMVIYLDAATNRRGSPNENFAREVMELFTLGQGNYAEADVKEAARAFTGWSLDPDAGRFMLRAGLHDDGSKTVLGRSGRLQGDDVLDVLLEQPATARFVVAKLWREFVSPAPDALRVEAIAQRWRASNYRIAVVMREILLQPELVARNEDNALVKSPVELVVGLVRQTGADLANPTGAAVAAAAMGQNLFSAPNVRGWPGGEAWINTQTLLARKQFIDRALLPPAAMTQAMRAAVDGAMTSAAAGAGKGDLEMAATEAPLSGQPSAAAAAVAEQAQVARFRRQLEVMQLAAVRIDPQQALKSSGGLQPERQVSSADVERLADQLLVLRPVSAPSAGTLGLDALRALLLDPAYQLK